MAAEATGAIQGTAMEISVSKFELLRELTATQEWLNARPPFHPLQLFV